AGEHPFARVQLDAVRPQGQVDLDDQRRAADQGLAFGPVAHRQAQLDGHRDQPEHLHAAADAQVPGDGDRASVEHEPHAAQRVHLAGGDHEVDRYEGAEVEGRLEPAQPVPVEGELDVPAAAEHHDGQLERVRAAGEAQRHGDGPAVERDLDVGA